MTHSVLLIGKKDRDVSKKDESHEEAAKHDNDLDRAEEVEIRNMISETIKAKLKFSPSIFGATAQVQ